MFFLTYFVEVVEVTTMAAGLTFFEEDLLVVDFDEDVFLEADFEVVFPFDVLEEGLLVDFFVEEDLALLVLFAGFFAAGFLVVAISF